MWDLYTCACFLAVCTCVLHVCTYYMSVRVLYMTSHMDVSVTFFSAPLTSHDHCPAFLMNHSACQCGQFSGQLASKVVMSSCPVIKTKALCAGHYHKWCSLSLDQLWECYMCVCVRVCLCVLLWEWSASLNTPPLASSSSASALPSPRIVVCWWCWLAASSSVCLSVCLSGHIDRAFVWPSKAKTKMCMFLELKWP